MVPRGIWAPGASLNTFMTSGKGYWKQPPKNEKHNKTIEDSGPSEMKGLLTLPTKVPRAGSTWGQRS